MKRSSMLLLLGIIFPMSLAYFFSFTPRLFQYGDNSGYLTLGVAFARGYGFADLAQPHQPHMLWWPPGFPLLISLFYQLAGPAWLLLKTILFGALGGVFFLWALTVFRRDGSFSVALTAGATLAISSAIHLLSSYLYSETFYIIVSLGFFILWYWGESRRKTWHWPILIFLALYVATIRLIGLSLPLACALYLAVKYRADKRWYVRFMWLWIVLPLILYLGAISLWDPIRVGSLRSFFAAQSPFAQSTDSVPFLSRRIHKILHSLRGYGLTLIPESLFGAWYHSWTMNKFKALFMLGVTLIVITGWLVTARRWVLLNLYTLLFGGVLMVYGPLYGRLVVPIVPFLLLYFVKGAEKLLAFVPNPRVRTIAFVGLGLLFLFDNGYRTCVTPRATMPVQFGDEEHQACLTYAENHLPDRSVVVSQVHSYLFLRRGPYSIPYRDVETVERFIAYLGRHKADYLIITPFYTRPHYKFMNIVREAIERYPQRFTRVYGPTGSRSFIVGYTHR